MAYVDQELKRKTRSKYNREEYAATKADSEMYKLYLERQRAKKRNRTTKKQGERIEEAVIRMQSTIQWTHPALSSEVFIKFAIAALYPERIKK